jgi:hypothetical protein
MEFRNLETSPYRLNQSRILRLPEGRLWILRAICLIEISIRDFEQIAFLDAQDAENEFVWPFDTLEHRFIDFTIVAFKKSRRQIMSSPGHSHTWNQFRDFLQVEFWKPRS